MQSIRATTRLNLHPSGPLACVRGDATPALHGSLRLAALVAAVLALSTGGCSRPQPASAVATPEWRHPPLMFSTHSLSAWQRAGVGLLRSGRIQAVEGIRSVTGHSWSAWAEAFIVSTARDVWEVKPSGEARKIATIADITGGDPTHNSSLNVDCAPTGPLVAIEITSTIYVMDLRHPSRGPHYRVRSGPSDELRSDRAPAWAPTGQRLAYQSNGRDGQAIRSHDVETGEDRCLVKEDRNVRPHSPSWSSDGGRLAYQTAVHVGTLMDTVVRHVYDRGPLRCLSLDDGRDTELLPRASAVSEAAWRPGTDTLAVVAGGKPLLLDVDSGESAPLPTQLEHVLNMAWSETGEWLAMVGSGPGAGHLTLVVHSMADGQEMGISDPRQQFDWLAWAKSDQSQGEPMRQ